LVDEKNAKPAADAAKTLASSLTSASSSFKKAELGGINIASKIPAVVKFAVRRMRSKALEQELRERGEIIEREIALQEAALAAVNQMMQTDRQALIKAGSAELVSSPFARAPELPEAWLERRRRMLTIESRVPSADAAVKAAAKLREAFIALMERGDTEPSVATLIAQARALASEVL
jgi:hypothetical protein